MSVNKSDSPTNPHDSGSEQPRMSATVRHREESKGEIMRSEKTQRIREAARHQLARALIRRRGAERPKQSPREQRLREKAAGIAGAYISTRSRRPKWGGGDGREERWGGTVFRGGPVFIKRLSRGRVFMSNAPRGACPHDIKAIKETLCLPDNNNRLCCFALSLRPSPLA